MVPIWLMWARPNFHCTWSHSFVFAAAVTVLLLPLDVGWALMALASLLLHYLADLPSTVGLPLLLPLSRRRFSLRLWARHRGGRLAVHIAA